MNKKTKLKLNVPYKTVDGHILTLLAKGSFKNYAGEFMYTYSIESKKATPWINHKLYSNDQDFIDNKLLIIEEDWREEYPDIAKLTYYLGWLTEDIETFWIIDNKAYIINNKYMIIQNTDINGDFIYCYKESSLSIKREIIKNAWVDKDDK